MIRVIYLFMLLLFSGATTVFAQNLKQIQNKADEYLYRLNYLKASQGYTQLLKVDELNPTFNFNMGLCIYGMNPSDQSAIKHFERAQAKYIDSYFYLGTLYHLQHKFLQARTAFEKYKLVMGDDPTFTKIEVDHRIAKTYVAEEFEKNPSPVKIKNIEGPINTTESEYVPLISADGNTMYFTGRKKTGVGGLTDAYGHTYEDIYVASKENGIWQTPTLAKGYINTADHDACAAISPQGNEMIVYKASKNKRGGDLYLSTLIEDTWQTPQLLPEEINSKGLELSASFTADGSIMYFSSDRKGGIGGKDIYRSTRFANGKWSKAVNLGSVINTNYDEDSPYISSDGLTLYFSSKSHKNMGGYDIFKSTYDLQTGEWSKVENLGYPINTVDDDIYFVEDATNQSAYYSSKRDDGLGESDIYQLVFESKQDNEAYNIVNAFVDLNKYTLNSSDIAVTLIDESTGNVAGEYLPNKKGKFILLTKPNIKYSYQVIAPGYKPLQGRIEESTTELKIELIKE